MSRGSLDVGGNDLRLGGTGADFKAGRPAFATGPLLAWLCHCWDSRIRRSSSSIRCSAASRAAVCSARRDLASTTRDSAARARDSAARRIASDSTWSGRISPVAESRNRSSRPEAKRSRPRTSLRNPPEGDGAIRRPGSAAAKTPAFQRRAAIGADAAGVEGPVLPHAQLGIKNRLPLDVVAPVVRRQDLEHEVGHLAFLPVLVRLPRSVRRPERHQDIRDNCGPAIALFQEQELVGRRVDLVAGEARPQCTLGVIQHVAV